MNDNPYQILLTPLGIGPKTTRNRFYQVPHCNGMGYRDPRALAKMREVKAEGGWGVVCTEEVEIHPSSDITPYIELRLWDDRDIPALAGVAEAIHRHGALAGIELAHNGVDAPNNFTREVPLAPSALPVATFTCQPLQARAMNKKDIRDLRKWHRDAVVRAEQAGFDLIYVYAAHSLSIFQHFLSRRFNQRGDEYGGTLENRARLLREVLEETQETVAGRCAVPCRISMDELRGGDGLEKAEMEDVIGMLAELPDLWDVSLSSWENDSMSSRFAEEGHEEKYFAGVKKLTTKPVVGVGRYTSVDRMASLIRKNVLDLIGAARPSIADPFLPNKVAAGRLEDIRECIGCNICVSGDFTMSPIRCTQNPAMGEEWRRKWHPERVRPFTGGDSFLIVGGGPAGMEAAHILGKRGARVTLAEAGGELGGRVLRESKLPGLAAWIRVRDYRAMQFHRLPNVDVHLNSALSAEHILEFGAAHVCIATGAHWRNDGVGRQRASPLPVADAGRVFTPDDLMDGRMPGGEVLVWDDDHYYMASVLAEQLAAAGCSVTYATPATEAATWTRATMEQAFIQRRLLEAGISVLTAVNLEAVTKEDGVTLSCIYTARAAERAAEAVVLVTARRPDDRLLHDLAARDADVQAAGIKTVTAIADALAPATIAHATHAGRKYAEDIDARPAQLRREIMRAD